MIKPLSIVATIILSATPSFAQSVGIPSMAVGVVDIVSNISCRNKARMKYFEIGARDMSPDDSNSQWATIGSMKSFIWCRGNQAFVSVAGNNYNSVTELRDELRAAF